MVSSWAAMCPRWRGKGIWERCKIFLSFYISFPYIYFLIILITLKINFIHFLLSFKTLCYLMPVYTKGIISNSCHLNFIVSIKLNNKNCLSFSLSCFKLSLLDCNAFLPSKTLSLYSLNPISNASSAIERDLIALTFLDLHAELFTKSPCRC